MRRRVVVTGIGVITPVGHDVESMWQVLRQSGSGIGRITHFDASRFPTKIAAEVKGFDLGRWIPQPERFAQCGRNVTFAIAAATEAVRAAGLASGAPDPTRFGVYLGAGEGQQDFGRFMQILCQSRKGTEVDLEAFTRLGLTHLDPETEIHQEPNVPAGVLASLFNAQGPNLNCLTACAASSQAIGEATEIIRRGDADIMLSGGAHSMIHPFGVTGFNLLTALSTHNENPAGASRPFDKNRDGFVLGEGAGMLVLEELEHALARKATIFGEVVGFGTTADAYRITDTHPEGRGAVSCIQMALKDAGLNTDQIDYINAHGTSTDVNDRVETMAIRKALGADAYKTPVSSVKSMMGHLIAAAGAVEAIVCLLTIRDHILPPTTNYETPDPDCDLDYVPNVARPAPVERALSNSFGFGGQNISLILSKFRA
ncbi:MAG: beta-ketoacyl-ACP synthase II [Planctomycetaceae bacterium]|jgi:3-oxoacyl-[acyl-carrier-protein] synthase II